MALDDARLIDEIMTFWFGTPDPEASVPDQRFARYWRRDDAFDAEIRQRFGELHARATRGELDHWAKTPRGRVALLILLDQFSRNLHRADPRAFENDAKALALALEGLGKNEHLMLPPMLAYFLFMPLMHCEVLGPQERGVALFDELASRCAGTTMAERCSMACDYARRHRDIVARFGRFPHRNGALGRQSTPEEVEFLKQPGSSF